MSALAFFVDPATGAPRLACGLSTIGLWCDVFDPVAGGEALARDRRWLGGECAGILHGPGDGRAAARLWVVMMKW